MSKELKEVKHSIFIIGECIISLFCIFIFLFQIPVFSLTCNDLDTAARLHISDNLCDSLKKVQDDDFIKVKIYVLGLPDKPRQPEKPLNEPDLSHWTDSVIKPWLDSVYNPWYLKDIALLAARADSVVKTFDLRDLNDTSKKLYTVPDSQSSLFCQIRVHDIVSVLHLPYIHSIEPYYLAHPLRIHREKFTLSKKIQFTKIEYFNLQGRKIIPGVKWQGSRPFGIVIEKGISSNSRILIQKVVY
jgi:hypothetical protein